MLCLPIVKWSSQQPSLTSLTKVWPAGPMSRFSAVPISPIQVFWAAFCANIVFALQGATSQCFARVARKKQCHIPAFLALIGTELRTCGVLREKEEEMELLKGYIEADSIPELWVKVTHRWVQDYSTTAPTEDITSCKVTEAQTSTASHRDGKSFLFCYIKPCLPWLY